MDRPHQVNRGLVKEVFTKTGLGSVPVVWDSLENGNIGGASILFSLAKAFAEKKFKKGDRILVVSVGGGLSYGAQVWKILA
jgi:3-oxoacyl-[acyl-carrier-protein] synthase-3